MARRNYSRRPYANGPVPDPRRLQQQLAEFQNELQAIRSHSDAHALELEHLKTLVGQQLAPFASVFPRLEAFRLPNGLYVIPDEYLPRLTDEIDRDISDGLSAQRKLIKKRAFLEVLGPLARSWREEIDHEIEDHSDDARILRNLHGKLAKMKPMFERIRFLTESTTRIRAIEYKISMHRAALELEARRPDTELESLRARAAANEKEVREAAARLRASIPRTDRCPYCEKLFLESHLDHIYPVSRGGGNARSNLVHICIPCNLAKGNLTLLEFSEKQCLDYYALVKRLRELSKRP